MAMARARKSGDAEGKRMKMNVDGERVGLLG
jgi:hypothetical protein